MRRRWAVAALMFVSALNSPLFARQGTVLTQDKVSYQGDVTEQPDKGTVTIVSRGIHTELKKANVLSIEYLDDVVADVNTRLAALGPDDVAGRVALAEYALEHHATAASRDVLLSAQKIAPADPVVRDKLERVNAQLRAEAPPAPVGSPATEPVVVQPPPPTTAPAATAGPLRLLTEDEINFIRQSELRSTDNVRVRIDGDLRKRFTDYVQMSPEDFAALPPIQQAFKIIDQGKPQMRRELKVLTDPAAIALYRRDVQRVLVAGCATSKCHGGTSAGSFRLFPQDSTAGAYGNFLILQQYMAQLQGRRSSLLDRQQPEQSLLLAYMLPPGTVQESHPDVKAYRGVMRNRSDVRYAATLAWIESLNPVAPDYSSIDLTHPPTTQPSDAGGP